MSADDQEFEPIPGLPHALPEGERILWQGRPRWRGLARHVFRLPWLAMYFGALVVARGINAAGSGMSAGGIVWAVVSVALLASLGLGLLALLAILHARGTVYTLTTRRVVMRFGVALPMSFNLPFKRLGSAELKQHEGGLGDIAFQISGKGRIGYAHLWPHARPFRFGKAQPMLRCIPDAAKVARLLADAVAAFAIAEGAQLRRGDGDAARPSEPASDGASTPGLDLDGSLATQAGR